ncbi:MAG TPA: cyclic nucleotide-binding domain-containing protein [Myxococcota bacterium]|nr:cyclic nucleotide-binding domain-containing protein [Myxococcota bacterium]
MSIDLLERLTERERGFLNAVATQVRLAAGEHLIRRGEKGGDIYRVVEGELEVIDNRSHPPVILDVIPRGGMVGEIAWLEDHHRSADVRAPDGAVVQRWEKRVLDRLLSEEPFLAAAFYRALASMLAERLRSTSTQVGIAERHREPGDDHTGRELARRCSARLLEVEPMLRRDRVQARAEVSTILHALGQELFETLAGLPEADATAVGRAVATEMHPYLVRSHLGELAMDPGESASIACLLHVDLGHPQGDGPLGELIDEWLLGLRSSRALRERRAELCSRVLENLPPEPPLRMMVVGASSPAFLQSLLEDLGRVGGELIVVDDRRESLDLLQQKLGSRPRNVRLRLEQRDPWELMNGRARIPHNPLHMVVLDGLLDHLPEQLAGRLLAWATQHLQIGGVLLASSLGPSPDDAIFRHLLDWPLVRRGPPMLTHLLQEAQLRDVQIHEEPGTGVGQVAMGLRHP